MVIFTKKKTKKGKSKKKEIDSRLIPEINIGMLGHIDHGKSTITQALTGKWPDTHSEEMKRGITIRLGYADATFYKCKQCEAPACYSTTDKCPVCFERSEPLRTVSFVDAPGHKTLMATVLSATSLIDGALLVIAANEKCPQPQTEEHLKALDIVGIDKIVIAQNKIDLVDEKRAEENFNEIKEFVKGTLAENSPIIPVSGSQRINLDALIKAIQETIPTPKRDLKADPKLLVGRSFDINKPGGKIENLKGGVIGGSLVQGKLKVGDEIELKPGVEREGEYKPIRTNIESLQKVGMNLPEVKAGGLIGVGTTLDPFLTKGDSLSGQIVSHPRKLPENKKELKLKVKLMERVVGVEKDKVVKGIKTNEVLMLSVGTSKSIGRVTSSREVKGENIIEVELKLPICAEKGERVSISRRIKNRWRLIGYGEVS